MQGKARQERRTCRNLLQRDRTTNNNERTNAKPSVDETTKRTNEQTNEHSLPQPLSAPHQHHRSLQFWTLSSFRADENLGIWEFGICKTKIFNCRLENLFLCFVQVLLLCGGGVTRVKSVKMLESVQLKFL